MQEAEAESWQGSLQVGGSPEPPVARSSSFTGILAQSSKGGKYAWVLTAGFYLGIKNVLIKARNEMELSRETLREKENCSLSSSGSRVINRPLSSYNNKASKEPWDTVCEDTHISLLGSHPLLAFGKFFNPLTFRTISLWDPDQPTLKGPLKTKRFLNKNIIQAKTKCLSNWVEEEMKDNPNRRRNATSYDRNKWPQVQLCSLWGLWANST